MRVSREQMAENRKRILDEAGRLFREKGFDAVSVSEVMKAAGLTHGGFYGHFASKDDLIAQTLAHTLSKAAGSKEAGASFDLKAYLDAYLSPLHCSNVGEGCSMAGLAAETLRQTPEARAAITEGLQKQIARMAAAQPEGDPADRRRAAIGMWAAMVGAIILARASSDEALSDEILQETRAWIDVAG